MITTTATATVTSVADSDLNQTLLSANSARRGFIISNTSSAILYIKFGATASTTDFTVALPANTGRYEMLGSVVYVGRIDGIWASNQSGAALVTEL